MQLCDEWAESSLRAAVHCSSVFCGKNSRGDQACMDVRLAGQEVKLIDGKETTLCHAGTLIGNDSQRVLSASVDSC